MANATKLIKDMRNECAGYPEIRNIVGTHVTVAKKTSTARQRILARRQTKAATAARAEAMFHWDDILVPVDYADY